MSGLNVARAVLAIAAGLVGLVLALPVVALLLPFWAVGLLTRGLRRYLEPRVVPWEELIEFYPAVGWKPRPNLNAHALDFSGDTYHVTTDASGWRGHRDIADSDVVVFGDSYAFGCGVDDAAFFADLPSDVRIKAIGCPAYSMVQPVLWMEELAPRLRGKLVVWLVYLGNDLDDSLRPSLLEYRAPFVRSVNGAGRWEIVSDHVDASKWTITSKEGSIASFIELCRPSQKSKRVFEASAYLIERARDICRAADAGLVVMTVPDLSPLARRVLARLLASADGRRRFDEGLPDRELAEICRRLDVEFIPLKDYLDPEDYLERDFHWNPRGHRHVAEIIRRLHRERRPEGGNRRLAESAAASPAAEHDRVRT